MANKYLGREDAPFGDEIWGMLDEVVISVAKAQLSGRKLLNIEGPHGLQMKSFPLLDKVVSENCTTLTSSAVMPIPMIETIFSLGTRDLATFEETGFSLDTSAVAKAAMCAAAAEDELVFQGNEALGIQGLLTSEGAQQVKLGNWEDIGTAASDIINAVTTLDEAGFHGPYLLALAPALYNKLHRLYPQGYQIELQHIESIVGGSVIKASGIKSGGVLIAEGNQYATILIGQDMTTGFVGPEESSLKFKITESLVPYIKVPASICVLGH